MRSAIVLGVVMLAACGGGDSTPSGAPASVNLTASGAAPSTFTLPSGGQVHYFNKDTAAHQIASTDCSDIGSPSLAAGQDFLTQALLGPRSCTFRDSVNPSNSAFQGTVTINAPGAGGGGGGSGY